MDVDLLVTFRSVTRMHCPMAGGSNSRGGSTSRRRFRFVRYARLWPLHHHPSWSSNRHQASSRVWIGLKTPCCRSCDARRQPCRWSRSLVPSRRHRRFQMRHCCMSVPCCGSLALELVLFVEDFALGVCLHPHREYLVCVSSFVSALPTESSLSATETDPLNSGTTCAVPTACQASPASRWPPCAVTGDEAVPEQK